MVLSHQRLVLTDERGLRWRRKTGTHHFQPASLPLVYEHSIVRSRWVVVMREDQDEVFTDDLDANGWSLKERGGDGDSGFSCEGVWFAR